MIFSFVPKVSLNVVTKRFMRKRPALKSWPNDWVPFHWSRPTKVHGSLDTGDLEEVLRPASSEVQSHLRQSEELRKLDVNDPARKIFSLDHERPYLQTMDRINRKIEEMGLVHLVDYPNSLEAKIVTLTHRLRFFQDAIKSKSLNDNFSGHLRTIASNCHTRRYRYLTDLKELHYDRYKKILEELKIEPKENKINVKYERPYRKKQMRRLAIEYSIDIKEKKVEEFMKSLEVEKKNFEVEKEETLRWIADKEKELGFNVS